MNPRPYLLQKVFNFNFMPLRTCSQLPEGIKYHGFTYYPRFKNFKDPPYEPSKLFLIKRIKSLRGTNIHEKRALQLLNIDGKKKDFGDVNVVKNIPSVNSLLWRIKHLIVVRPITWKGELPQIENCSEAYVRETGEIVISPKLKVTSEQIEISENFQKSSKKLDRKYLKEYLKTKWLNGFSGDI